MQSTIFLVDDDDAFLDSLAALVKSMNLASRAFTTSGEFLADFDPETPGCVILDLRMPGIDGLSLQRQLAEMRPQPVVIVLTGHAEVGSTIRALKQGAAEFLQKHTFSETELWEAIHRALNLNEARRNKHLREKEVLACAAELTGAEREVLSRILAGASNLEIAAQLGVSRRTVENRRARLMRKVGVTSLAELVGFSIEAGLFQH